MNIIILLSGGLGLFLLGMKMMSEGLSNAAGDRFRHVLGAITKNRLAGIIVGALFTAVIQSSSAAMVIVVGLVNAGLMTLLQATGIIMGANIGTTVTSQLVALDLSEIAPLFTFIGIIIMLACKKPGPKYMGEVVLGFGVLFMGLNTMSASIGAVKNSPKIVEALSELRNPVLAIAAGLVITAIIQSSSVTVSIVLLMAVQGLLMLPICFYIILGCNIGTCVTALLASLGGKKEAKRAAWIHVLLNVCGSLAIALALAVGMDGIEAGIRYISSDKNGNVSIGKCVANAHTIFKVLEVILLFPLAGWLVHLTYIIVPEKGKRKGKGYWDT